MRTLAYCCTLNGTYSVSLSGQPHARVDETPAGSHPPESDAMPPDREVVPASRPGAVGRSLGGGPPLDFPAQTQRTTAVEAYRARRSPGGGLDVGAGTRGGEAATLVMPRHEQGIVIRDCLVVQAGSTLVGMTHDACGAIA